VLLAAARPCRRARTVGFGGADGIGPLDPKAGASKRRRGSSGIDGAIIKMMHRAMTGTGRDPDVLGLALDGKNPTVPVLGGLVAGPPRRAARLGLYVTACTHPWPGGNHERFGSRSPRLTGAAGSRSVISGSR